MMADSKCEHNIWTDAETWIDPKMSEEGTRKCEVCLVCEKIVRYKEAMFDK